METTITSADQRRRAYLFWLACSLALAVIAVIPTGVGIDHYLHHAYDLGIYARASHCLSFSELNPYISALDKGIFNDHFDPIILLAAPLARIISPQYAVFAMEFLFAILSSALCFCLFRRGILSRNAMMIAVAYLCLNKGLISALQFPAHPTTWAVLPMAIICVSYLSKRWSALVVGIILLLACKEEFVFFGLCFALGLRIFDRRRIGTALFALCLLWGLFAFFLRPLLLGPTTDFSARILDPLLDAPLQSIGTALGDPDFARRLLQCLLPLLPFWIWLAKRRLFRISFPMMLGLLPLFLIRALGGAVEFHYMAVFCVGLFFCVLPPQDASPPKWIVIACVCLLLAAADSPIRSAWRVYVEGRSEAGLILSAQRKQDLDKAVDYLLKETEGVALLGGNLYPALAQRDHVYHIFGPKDPSRDSVRFLLVEKPPLGNPWPRQHADVNALIAEWNASEDVITISDNDKLYFAERRK